MTSILSETAKNLTVYMRTPQWVSFMPAYRGQVAKSMHWLFE